MEKITDKLNCVVCSSEAMSEFNHSTGEEFVHCTHCGYHRRFYITNWALKAESTPEKPWVPQYEIFQCTEPFGAFDVRYKDGNGECGTFIEKENEEEFLDQVDGLLEEIESATISKYVDGKIVVIKVV